MKVVHTILHAVVSKRRLLTISNFDPFLMTQGSVTVEPVLAWKTVLLLVKNRAKEFPNPPDTSRSSAPPPLSLPPTGDPQGFMADAGWSRDTGNVPLVDMKSGFVSSRGPDDFLANANWLVASLALALSRPPCLPLDGECSQPKRQ